MIRSLSSRLLPLLQITRMALVFTAISNAQCTLLLRAKWISLHDKTPMWLPPADVLAIAIVSIGLYGFGMSLNDIIDRRRDSQIAAHRPLPSGRIGLVGAYAACISLGAAALAAGTWYAFSAGANWFGAALLIFTGLLIVFYDFAGKYLVAVGLLTLGLVRFFHSAIPAPQMPLVWHPLLLLNHTALLSTVAYAWEDKRPALTRPHVLFVVGGLFFIDVMVLGLTWLRARAGFDPFLLGSPLLLLAPLAGVLAFIAVAWRIRSTSPTPRAAGQGLMLAGLLWLIVYDALFAVVYVAWWAGLALLGLLPIAYLAVVAMRWWSKLILISQKSEFRRVES